MEDPTLISLLTLTFVARPAHVIQTLLYIFPFFVSKNIKRNFSIAQSWIYIYGNIICVDRSTFNVGQFATFQHITREHLSTFVFVRVCVPSANVLAQQYFRLFVWQNSNKTRTKTLSPSHALISLLSTRSYDQNVICHHQSKGTGVVTVAEAIEGQDDGKDAVAVVVVFVGDYTLFATLALSSCRRVFIRELFN